MLPDLFQRSRCKKTVETKRKKTGLCTIKLLTRWFLVLQLRHFVRLDFRCPLVFAGSFPKQRLVIEPIISLAFQISQRVGAFVSTGLRFKVQKYNWACSRYKITHVHTQENIAATIHWVQQVFCSVIKPQLRFRNWPHISS